ncbi:MAG TPA: hypothetical protein VHY31_03090 [Streptosporangiaceae bacterium]|nr:hypothetical protein [Streptosporangiaceae bacterium]
MTSGPPGPSRAGDHPPGRRPAGQRLAEYLIGRACRRLPGEARDERYREWTAELPAILHDPRVRLPLLRTVRALFFAAGISRTTRRLRRIRVRAGRSGAGASLGNDGRRGRSTLRRVVVGLAIYLAVLTAFVWYGQTGGSRGVPPLVAVVLVSGAAFVAFCLNDLARAKEVRYLPKWGWAIACLIQVPLGGILYLTAGRIHGDRS